MSFSIGKVVKFNIFGASHDICVGGSLEGLPAGTKIDFERIESDLSRRRPSAKGETKRVERDEFLFVSGLEDGHTTEAPFTFAIKNEDIKPEDYDKISNIFRPGHADYSKYIKYSGNAFRTGGGIFSGRMTAPIVVAGSVVMDILSKMGITIESKIIFGESGTGARIKVSVHGVKAGVGEPFFDSFESEIAHAMFSIPAVKGVNFGEIENLYSKTIEDIYDEYEIKEGEPKLKHNYWGGVDGGITNGEEIYFYTLLKPIQTHDFQIQTVDKEYNALNVKFGGRHDKNISKRVQVVLESMTAIVLYDLIRRGSK